MRKRVLERIKEQGRPLFWADLKWGCRSKKTSIPKLRNSSGATIDEPTEALEELAKHWGELGKQQIMTNSSQEEIGEKTITWNCVKK